MAHHRPAEPREQMSPQERAETRERSMALLRQMLRPHRGALALSIISVLLVSGSSAIAPILIARVLDSSIEPLKQGDVSPLLTLLVFFVAATAVTAIFSWVNVAYTVRVSLGVVVYLRKRVFRHAQSLSVSFHERYTSGKVISRLTSDIDTVRSFLDSGISQLAITLLSMVISGLAYWSVHAGHGRTDLLLDALVPEDRGAGFPYDAYRVCAFDEPFCGDFYGYPCGEGVWCGGADAL